MSKLALVVASLCLAILLPAFGCLGGVQNPPASNLSSSQVMAESWLKAHASTYMFDSLPNSLALSSTQSLPSGCVEYVYSFQSSQAGYGNRMGRMMAQMLTAHNITIHICDGNVTWANTDGVYDEIRQTDICMMLSAVIEVCGADNQTYRHPCFAKAKGIAIAHEGACAAVRPPRGTEGGFCGGIAGFQCQDGLTCRLDGDYPDAGGICIKPGESIVCTTEYAPVCGTDNHTYSNLCFARAARVSIAHEGECNAGAQLANPASVYCTKSGGALEIRKDAQGGEAGYCTLANGTVCEEWALFRGECGLVSDTCQSDSDCGYAWFSGACHNPAWVRQRQELAANQGLLLGEAPPRENVTCTCVNKTCITHG